MSVSQRNNVSYGLSQALINDAPVPIISKRSPTVNDFAIPGTIWTNTLIDQVFILASIIANQATWVQIVAAGGGGVLASLIVNPGPTILDGALTISTGPTSITGAVTMTNGNLSLTLGNLLIPVGDIVLGALNILSGAGSPAGAIVAPQGSLYLRTDGTGVANRAYIATDSVGGWTAISTVA